MRRILSILFLLVCFGARAADQELTALTQITVVTNTDLAYTVSNAGPTSFSINWSNVLGSIQAFNNWPSPTHAQLVTASNVVWVWANSVSNLAQTKQTGSLILSNLVGTVANNVTNFVSLSISNATSKPLTSSYSAGVLTMFGLQAGDHITATVNPSNIVVAISTTFSGRVDNLEGATNGLNTGVANLQGATNGIMTRISNLDGSTNALDALVRTKQQGTSTLTNLSGTGAVTNLYSSTLSNATIKPLVVGVGTAAGATNATGQIRGLEAGSNVTLSENGSNIVIAASGTGDSTINPSIPLPFGPTYAASNQFGIIAANGTTPVALGMSVASTTGTVSHNDASASLPTHSAYVSAATTSAAAGIASGAQIRTGRSNILASVVAFCRTNPTSARYWFGISSSTTPETSDTIPNNSAAFRYSTAAGDTTFQFVTKGTGSQTATDTMVAFAANTIYSFVTIKSNGNWYGYIDGVSVATNTSNLPGDASASVVCRGLTTENVAKDIVFQSLYFQQNIRP